MKSASLSTIVFAVSTLLFAQNTKAASPDPAFDGTWSVTLNAPAFKDPTGLKVLGFVFNFPATVKNGILHGEHGTKGAVNWLAIDGKIDPSGTAILHGNGITGRPESTLGYERSGTPYNYQIDVHFNGRNGPNWP